MNDDPPHIYDLMQRAVDIVEESAHPKNKVAATLHTIDSFGQDQIISRTNYWPDILKKHFPPAVKIGNSSATIHAETACLIEASTTDKAALFVTDLPCPNCVKNMVEAGVSALYIDHKGFEKDFALRRGDHFENMSLRICEKSGINVYKIFRKEKRREPLIEHEPDYSPAIENPPRLITLREAPSEELFSALLSTEKAFYNETPFALALAESQHGHSVLISAQPHPVMGYTARTLAQGQSKYSFFLQPIARILMTARRYNLIIQGEYLFSSGIPTSRELVNMIGAEFHRLRIGDKSQSRDEFGPQAFKQLSEFKIIHDNS